MRCHTRRRRSRQPNNDTGAWNAWRWEPQRTERWDTTTPTWSNSERVTLRWSPLSMLRHRNRTISPVFTKSITLDRWMTLRSVLCRGCAHTTPHCVSLVSPNDDVHDARKHPWCTLAHASDHAVRCLAAASLRIVETTPNHDNKSTLLSHCGCTSTAWMYLQTQQPAPTLDNQSQAHLAAAVHTCSATR